MITQDMFTGKPKLTYHPLSGVAKLQVVDRLCENSHTARALLNQLQFDDYMACFMAIAQNKQLKAAALSRSTVSETIAEIIKLCKQSCIAVPNEQAGYLLSIVDETVKLLDATQYNHGRAITIELAWISKLVNRVQQYANAIIDANMDGLCPKIAV